MQKNFFCFRQHINFFFKFLLSITSTYLIHINFTHTNTYKLILKVKQRTQGWWLPLLNSLNIVSNQSSHSLEKEKEKPTTTTTKNTDISEPVAYKIISSLGSHSQQVTKPANSSPSLLYHSSKRDLLQKGRFPKNPCDFLNELNSNDFDHKPSIVLSNINTKYKLGYLKSKIFYL